LNTHWGIRIPKDQAEEKRQQLIHEGLLDRERRPLRDGNDIVLPVLQECPGAEAGTFQEYHNRAELPRHELIGGIAVMHENDPKEAARLLASRPKIHSVLFAESAVSGEYRTKDYTVLAGENTTLTDYTEYGLHFTVDLSAAYFSARLSNERQRVLNQSQPGERVIDMFTGVGPFAITLAKKASFVAAGDLNPEAVVLLEENIRRNHCENILPMLADARHLPAYFGPASFDRVIMNLPMGAQAFLDEGLSLCREGGTVHFYVLQESEGQYCSCIREKTAGRVSERVVRSYSAALHHAVYDIEMIRRP